MDGNYRQVLGHRLTQLIQMVMMLTHCLLSERDDGAKTVLMFHLPGGFWDINLILIL